MIRPTLVAIGRSSLLLHTIRHLANRGFSIRGIITDEQYPEYGVGVDDFRDVSRELNASFLTTKSITPHVLSTVRDWLSEGGTETAGISANWRFIVPEAMLNLFSMGVLNVHIGSLPDFKGNATANWSILSGESSTYVNVHRMAVELDAGDIIARQVVPINSSTYVGEILATAESATPALFELALSRLVANPAYCEASNGPEGSRCFPRLPEDGLINWNDSAESILRLVRATSHPYPGAYTYYNGRHMMIWKARPALIDQPFLAVAGHVLNADSASGVLTVACGDGAVLIEDFEFQDGNVTDSGPRGLRSRLGGGPAQPNPS